MGIVKLPSRSVDLERVIVSALLKQNQILLSLTSVRIYIRWRKAVSSFNLVSSADFIKDLNLWQGWKWILNRLSQIVHQRG